MMERPYDELRANLEHVRQMIDAACREAGRRAEEITLLGVTKTVEPDRINAMLELGLRHIGENRVQEYLGKRDALNLEGVDMHLIGHLQTNKVSRIVGMVDMIESVDSLRVAQAIHEASVKLNRRTDILVEVNIGGEEAKSGTTPSGLPELLSEIGKLSGVSVRGLMTVAPILETEREKRALFSHMYKLFIDIRAKKLDNVSMDVLSMGMSSDYRVAILEGATLVRIGSALFGRRI